MTFEIAHGVVFSCRKEQIKNDLARTPHKDRAGAPVMTRRARHVCDRRSHGPWNHCER